MNDGQSRMSRSIQSTALAGSPPTMILLAPGVVPHTLLRGFLELSFRHRELISCLSRSDAWSSGEDAVFLYPWKDRSLLSPGSSNRPTLIRYRLRGEPVDGIQMMETISGLQRFGSRGSVFYGDCGEDLCHTGPHQGFSAGDQCCSFFSPFKALESRMDHHDKKGTT
jgi:hypothetical protein